MKDHWPQAVFVYGTLCRGGSNHRLLRRARYLGRHHSKPVYTLLDLGAYPGAIRGGVTGIRGEVYAVDKLTMGLLDRLEDYPELYTRELITTPYGRAWIYLYRPPAGKRRLIRTGLWRRT